VPLPCLVGLVCPPLPYTTLFRSGAIGARPTAFNTVRYSEKILESQGISIETLDPSEVLGRIERMKDDSDAAQAKLAAIQKYVDPDRKSTRLNSSHVPISYAVFSL